MRRVFGFNWSHRYSLYFWTVASVAAACKFGLVLAEYLRLQGVFHP